MPALIVRSAARGLLDFTYDGEQSPSGVLDARLPPGILGVILAVEPQVREAFISVRQRMDCGYACAAWRRALESQDVETEMIGGVGVDDDAVTSDFRIVPAEARSGYREADGQIHRHFWLLIGPDRLLFDPTAHQFDAKGGVSLDRYVIDGRRRASQLSSPVEPRTGGFVAGMRRQFDVLRQMQARSGETYELARERGRAMSEAYRNGGAPRRVSKVRTRDGWAFERHVREGLGQWRIEPATEAEWLAWTAWRSDRRRLRTTLRGRR